MSAVSQMRETLLAKIAEIEAEAGPLRAALEALEDQAPSKPRSGGRASKPSANREVVERVCRSLLSDNGVLLRDELEGLAKGKVTGDERRSLSGFKQAFSACIASEAFTIDADGSVRLADDPIEMAVDNHPPASRSS